VDLDRRLEDAREAEPPSYDQQLEVERVSLLDHHREDGGENVSPYQLESRLCVADLDSEEDPSDDVVHPTEETA